MKGKLDKLRIELYGNGVFQGYVKNVSMTNSRLASTMNKYDAKTYSTQKAAGNDIDKIMHLTNGALACNIV